MFLSILFSPGSKSQLWRKRSRQRPHPSLRPIQRKQVNWQMKLKLVELVGSKVSQRAAIIFINFRPVYSCIYIFIIMCIYLNVWMWYAAGPPRGNTTKEVTGPWIWMSIMIKNMITGSHPISEIHQCTTDFMADRLSALDYFGAQSEAGCPRAWNAESVAHLGSCVMAWGWIGRVLSCATRCTIRTALIQCWRLGSLTAGGQWSLWCHR